MDRIWIIVIGGLIPAFAFGTSAIFQKGAMQAGMGAGTYLLYNGLIMAAAGLALRPALSETNWGSGQAILLALMGDLLFAVASGAINLAVARMAAPIAPITVISSLVTVILGFIVFREHIGVKAVQLMGGALLVVGGAALVATS
jgi:drug/metabolite transporter (DMT)-like permease